MTPPDPFSAERPIVEARFGRENACAGWPEPEPLSTPPSPFPGYALTPWMREMAQAGATAKQATLDLYGSLVLGAATIAVHRTHEILVGNDHRSPLGNYLCVALQSGEAKSPAMSDCLGPIFAFERQRAKEMEEAVREGRDRIVMLSKRLDAAQTRAGRASGETAHEAEADMRNASEVLAEAIRTCPRAPEWTTDDCTPEALAALLAEQGGATSIASSEDGPFEMMAGRYDGKGKSRTELYCKAWSGDEHKVHRRGSDPIHLPRPKLAVVLTVQPSVVQGLAAKDGFRSKGLLARFLFSMPEPLAGTRLARVEGVPAAIRDRYRRAIHCLMAIEGEDGPRLIRLAAEAEEMLHSFCIELELQIAPGEALQDFSDVVGKLKANTARLAGVLHLADMAEAETIACTIPAPTMRRAIVLARYFLSHTLRAFDAMDAPPADLEDARRLLAWVMRRRDEHGKGSSFTPRDAKRSNHRRFKSIDDVTPGLDRLVAHGFVRPVHRGEDGRVITYELNPRA